MVASSSVLCDMTEQIAGNSVDLTCLIDFNQDPHTYEGTPSDRLAIERANLVVYGGLNFEPAIIRMVGATRTPAPKIPVHERAVTGLLQLQKQGETVDDPHVWHDVENGIRMVQILTSALSKLEPDRAADYAQQSQALNAELRRLDTWIAAQIRTIPANRRQLITTHDAFGYYSRAYGLNIAGTLLGLTTEEEPTAARVRQLIAAIRAAGVPTVFAELTSNDRVLRSVAAEAEVEISQNVLIADGIGAKGTPEGSYQGMLVYNTCTIVTGLGGQCTPFESE